MTQPPNDVTRMNPLIQFQPMNRHSRPTREIIITHTPIGWNVADRVEIFEQYSVEKPRPKAATIDESMFSDIPSLKSDDIMLDFESTLDYLSSGHPTPTPAPTPRLTMELSRLIEITLDFIMHEREEDWYIEKPPNSTPPVNTKSPDSFANMDTKISDYAIITGLRSPRSPHEVTKTVEEMTARYGSHNNSRRTSFAERPSLLPVSANRRQPKYVERPSFSREERLRMFKDQHSVTCCANFETCPKKTIKELVGFFDRRESAQNHFSFKANSTHSIPSADANRKPIDCHVLSNNVESRKVSIALDEKQFDIPLSYESCEYFEDWPIPNDLSINSSDNDFSVHIIHKVCSTSSISNVGLVDESVVLDEHPIATTKPEDSNSLDPNDFIRQDHVQIAKAYPSYAPRAIPDALFNSAQDAHALKKAMKGGCTDQQTLIDIIACRSKEQLRLIQFDYSALLGCDLKQDLREATDGNLRDILLAILSQWHYFYVNQGHEKMGTVLPFRYFNVHEDVRFLRQAIKQSDRKTLISIICRRTNDQLKIVQAAYANDLYKDVRSVTKGRLRELLCSILLPRDLFYVNQKHWALMELESNVEILIAIMCSLADSEHGVQESYLSFYRHHVANDSTAEFNDVLRLVESMCYTKRDVSPADTALARLDAADLLSLPTERQDPEGNVFARILTRRSFLHIRAVDQCCQVMARRSVLDIVTEFTKGVELIALTTIVTYALDPIHFFATRLHKSLSGQMPEDGHLIRVLVLRCEIDLRDIREKFELLYGVSLSACIKERAAGEYRMALLSLINDKDVVYPQY